MCFVPRLSLDVGPVQGIQSEVWKTILSEILDVPKGSNAWKAKKSRSFFQLADRVDDAGYTQKKLHIRQMAFSSCKEQIKANFLTEE